MPALPHQQGAMMRNENFGILLQELKRTKRRARACRRLRHSRTRRKRRLWAIQRPSFVTRPFQAKAETNADDERDRAPDHQKNQSEGHGTLSRWDSIKSITLFLVLKRGSRPALRLQTKVGSFNACTPKAVGVVPVLSRNRSTSESRASTGLSIIVTTIVGSLSCQ